MKKLSGFTLVELMVTVVIVGTLMTVGLPQLKTFMQGSQLVAASNELVSAMNVARSEAIKRNARVTICESSDGMACSATGDWGNGWVVFVDADGDADQAVEEDCSAAVVGKCRLRVHEAVNDDPLTIIDVAAVSSFTFTSRGMPKSTTGQPQSGRFSVCSYDASDVIVGSRAVVLSLSGRVRISDNEEIITCQ